MSFAVPGSITTTTLKRPGGHNRLVLQMLGSFIRDVAFATEWDVNAVILRANCGQFFSGKLVFRGHLDEATKGATLTPVRRRATRGTVA